MNDDSIAKHMYCHVWSVLLTGQKKKKKKKKKKEIAKPKVKKIALFDPTVLLHMLLDHYN